LSEIKTLDQSGVLRAAGAFHAIQQGIPAIGVGPIARERAVAGVTVAQVLLAAVPEFEQETLQRRIGACVVIPSTLDSRYNVP
jgi:hypothetical protein